MLDLGLAVMRGERERPRVHMAYWLLAALYAFAMLGNAVAAGEGMLQDVALCIPLVTAAVPLGVGVAAGAATEAAATRLSEHVVPSEEAVAASVEAWCDVFMRDFQEQHCVDRRWSNGGGHSVENRNLRKKDAESWEKKADWIRRVERLKQQGIPNAFAAALRQQGITYSRFEDGKRVRSAYYRTMLQRLRLWCSAVAAGALQVTMPIFLLRSHPCRISSV